MEGIVRQVFADAGFRSRFLATPEAVLSGTDLSDAQRGALVRLASQMRARGSAGEAGAGAAESIALMWL